MNEGHKIQSPIPSWLSVGMMLLIALPVVAPLTLLSDKAYTEATTTSTAEYTEDTFLPEGQVKLEEVLVASLQNSDRLPAYMVDEDVSEWVAEHIEWHSPIIGRTDTYGDVPVQSVAVKATGSGAASDSDILLVDAKVYLYYEVIERSVRLLFLLDRE